MHLMYYKQSGNPRKTGTWCGEEVDFSKVTARTDKVLTCEACKEEYAMRRLATIDQPAWEWGDHGEFETK